MLVKTIGQGVMVALTSSSGSDRVPTPEVFSHQESDIVRAAPFEGGMLWPHIGQHRKRPIYA